MQRIDILVSLAIVGIVLLSFGIAYGLFKLLGKGKSPFKRVGFWATFVLGIPTLYVVAVASFILIASYSPSHEFSKEEWLHDPSHRTQYVDDLIDSKILDGLSRVEVEEVLGTPDSTDYFANMGRDMIYWLGTERGFMGIDSEWLLIWLENGKVVRYEIAID